MLTVCNFGRTESWRNRRITPVFYRPLMQTRRKFKEKICSRFWEPFFNCLYICNTARKCLYFRKIVHDLFQDLSKEYILFRKKIFNIIVEGRRPKKIELLAFSKNQRISMKISSAHSIKRLLSYPNTSLMQNMIYCRQFWKCLYFIYKVPPKIKISVSISESLGHLNREIISILKKHRNWTASGLALITHGGLTSFTVNLFFDIKDPQKHGFAILLRRLGNNSFSVRKCAVFQRPIVILSLLTKKVRENNETIVLKFVSHYNNCISKVINSTIDVITMAVHRMISMRFWFYWCYRL